MYGLVKAAIMASGATALMIPPDTSLEAQSIYTVGRSDARAAAQVSGVNPISQLVELPCPGCPFAHFQEGGVSWTKDQKNHLVLNVSVSADSQRLELNGAQFYPPPMGPKPEPEVLQIPADLTVEDVQTYQRIASPARSLRLTSWSLHAGGVRKANQWNDELIKAQIRIEALEGYPVEVPELEVIAIKTRSSGLSIVKADITSGSRKWSAGECNGWPMLCEWRQRAASRLHSMQSKVRSGCHKMGLSKLVTPLLGRPDEPEQPHVLGHKDMHRLHHHKKVHHHSPHRHHRQHMHHRVNHVLHEVSRLILTIAIPILFGILAGMMTYMLGLALGTAVAMLWHMVRGRRQRQSRIRLGDSDEQEQALLHIKEGFEEAEIEVPPLYVEVEGS